MAPSTEASGSPWPEKGCGAGDGVWGEEGGCCARTTWDGTSGRDDAGPEQTHRLQPQGWEGARTTLGHAAVPLLKKNIGCQP